jgi:RNA polymerase sigma-70 factor (ECF subfamily)
VNPDGRRARFAAVAPSVIDAVRRYLARRTDPAIADDVLSETLLTCWRRIDDMPDEHVLWAYGIARRTLANAERGRRRQARLAAKIARLDPPVAVTESHQAEDEAITTALAGLRPEDAELLRLWAWEDLAPGQIAVVLDVSVNAVNIRLHRAKARLREKLGPAATPPHGERPGETPSHGERPGATPPHGEGPGATPSHGERPGDTPSRDERPGGRKPDGPAGHEEATEGRGR